MAARLRRAGSSPLGWLGAYYIATGIFPFVSRRAFEAITGPKREWWLVETVGGLVTAVGAGMLGASLRHDEPPREILGVAAGCAATLAAIDVVYTARGRLRPVYLVDAAVEMAGLAALVRRGARGS